MSYKITTKNTHLVLSEQEAIILGNIRKRYLRNWAAMAPVSDWIELCDKAEDFAIYLDDRSKELLLNTDRSE